MYTKFEPLWDVRLLSSLAMSASVLLFSAGTIEKQETKLKSARLGSGGRGRGRRE
jgi:hypothetical protein